MLNILLYFLFHFGCWKNIRSLIIFHIAIATENKFQYAHQRQVQEGQAGAGCAS